VLLATRWIIAKLRKRTFFSLVELNAAIAVEVMTAALTPPLGTRPREVYE